MKNISSPEKEFDSYRYNSKGNIVLLSSKHKSSFIQQFSPEEKKITQEKQKKKTKQTRKKKEHKKIFETQEDEARKH